MGLSWSESVATREWRQDAELWIGDTLTGLGTTVTGPIEQTRIRPWSTQMTVPTDAGIVWFKANCPGNAFEAQLQKALADLVPDFVEDPLAIDDSRGWMLTSDHGPSLGDQHEPTVADWQEVVAQAAGVQRLLAGEKQSLVDSGLPDYSPATVPERFDSLVERLASLPPHHPSFVSVDITVKLEAARPRIVDAAQRLDESPIPDTFQHGDVHPWNVFVDKGRIKLFDFGDAQWAFAFESLSVPYGWITDKKVIAWEPVRDAYRDTWSDLVSAREFEALWCASELTHSVNRSATWWRGIQGASDEEWIAWGEAPRLHLINVLEGPR